MVNKIYSELGIKPIINAIGSVTLLGGSTQPQQVIDAMQSAQDMYAPMDELEQESVYEHQESVELSRGIEASRVQADRELLDTQQQEYERCLEDDVVANIVEDVVSETVSSLSEGRELSPEELREIRLQRFA